MKTKNFLLFFLMSIFFFTACEKDVFKGELKQRTSYLYLDFCNPDTNGDGTTGDAPQIFLDSSLSSKSINIDFSKEFSGSLGSDNMVNIVIDNLRIADEFGNFKIQKIIAEEYIDGYWQPQSSYETPVLYEGVKDLNIVLVLDASASMTESIDSLKLSAVDFIDEIMTKMPESKIGIVSFSDSVNVLQTTNNKDSVVNYIENLQASGSITYLYRSMLKGIDMLQNAEAKSKVLVTFTDGYDNETIFSKDSVITKLNEDVSDFIKIQSYVIGFESDIDINREVLKSLCVRGFALFPTTAQELKDFFNYFSKVVSTVYNITYKRNSVKVPEDEKLKIRLKFITLQES